MTDRELALSYCRAHEASMIEALMTAEQEIAARLDIDPVYLRDPKFRQEKISAFVSAALAFDSDRSRTVGVRFLKPPAGIVRPENPYRFVSHEVFDGTVGAMIVEGPVPIEPPPGWVVVLLHDLEGHLLCTTMPPDEVEVIR